jgi:hypothetical protein
MLLVIQTVHPLGRARTALKNLLEIGEMGKAKPCLRVDIEFEFTNVSNDYDKHYPDRRVKT